MELHINQPLLALDAGQVLTLDDAAGTRIEPRRGTVWVTEEDSRQDHIIGPGDVLVVTHGGRTVIQAMRHAWISLAEGTPAAPLEPTVERFDPDEHLFEMRHRLSRYY